VAVVTGRPRPAGLLPSCDSDPGRGRHHSTRRPSLVLTTQHASRASQQTGAGWSARERVSSQRQDGEEPTNGIRRLQARVSSATQGGADPIGPEGQFPGAPRSRMCQTRSRDRRAAEILVLGGIGRETPSLSRWFTHPRAANSALRWRTAAATRWRGGVVRCSKVRDLLHCFLDGELDPVRKVTILKHVEHCWCCRSCCALERRFRAAIEAGCREPIPPLVRRSLLGALRDRRPGSPQNQAAAEPDPTETDLS